METKTMSSAFADLKIDTMTSDGEVGSSRTRGAATGKVDVASGNVGAPRKSRALGDANRILMDGRSIMERHGGKTLPRPARRREENEDKAIPKYRRRWKASFGGVFGSFDDETALAPMRYTSGPIPENATPGSTLQIFSVSVANPKYGLFWPLDVYGFVATRDSADHNRNFLFTRTRDNYQTLTEENPDLVLTGPSRAIVLADLITFEIQLKVKGSKTESDEVLTFKVIDFHQGSRCQDGMLNCVACTRCTLQFDFTPLLCSVEATVSIQLVDGSWPDNHQGQVFSCANGIENPKAMLLDCPDGKMPIDSDGVFELSRRVVSVEFGGSDKLVVYVQALRVGLLRRADAVFEPKKSGTSIGTCDLRCCKMQVTVAWSIPSLPCHTVPLGSVGAVDLGND